MIELLKVESLDIYYGESLILKKIDLRIKAGQVVCLMGRNGVGKSTLLKSIMGLLKPKTGHIYYEDEEITYLSPDARAKRGIGYVPQGRDIFPEHTVEENLILGLETNGSGRGSMPEEIFNLFPAIKNMLARPGGDLSGGQQQQLAIARAMASRPKLLLLDEPTEGIQPSIIKEIAAVIQLLKKRGNIAILLVEQYLKFALELADYYYIMQKGSIVSQGPIDNLKDETIKAHLTI